MKFEPGQRVFVKTSGYNPDDMVPQMQRFMGKIVTISSNTSGNRRGPYCISEDPRWVWHEELLTYYGESTDPNVLFKMGKR